MKAKTKALKSSNIPSTTHKTRPVLSYDKALSKKHLEESIMYNEKHAEEHEKNLKKSERLLKQLKK